jgi:hypothetical protein
MVQSGQVHPYDSVPEPKKPLWRNPISLAVVGVVVVAIVGATLILIRPSSSAQSTASTAVGYLQTGNWAKFCTLVEPAERTNCNVAIKEQTGSAYPKLVLASVTTSGDQATVTVTCHGASYCTRFTGSNATAQLVKVNGTWFLAGDFSASSAGSSGTTGNSEGETTTTENLGSSGNSGGAGISGNSGITGTSGNSGGSGISGTTGSSGNTGVPGSSGSASTTTSPFGNSGNSGNS